MGQIRDGKTPNAIKEGKSSRSLNEVRLILVGQGAVGKTALVQRLLANTFNPNESMTSGITISNWQIMGISNQKGENIRLNIWSFGGQEIMHATHQFFLTKRSLYLLVLDSRLPQEENRVEYWLKIIQSFGGESPVLIVGNKTDQHPLDIDRTGLQRKYPNIVGILETSAATGTGIEALKREIVNQVNNLPHIHDLLPETWFTVKSILEELGKSKNFISLDEYINLCNKNDVIDETSQHTLIGFLHDLGIVLHFQDDPRLESIVILNPMWITNGVYKILNSHELFQNQGTLTLPMLYNILNQPEYPSNMRLFIVDMMKKFELCYDIESGKSFLVPDLLPKDEPYTGDWSEALAFEIQYNVLPSSIISRFIVRMNTNINKTVWRSGVVLKNNTNTALVKADFEDRIIRIWVSGEVNTRRNFLSIIRHQFDSIHNTIARLEVVERIPLRDNPQTSIDYRYLLNLKNKGVKEFIPSDLSDTVNVDELLISIESKEQIDSAAATIKNATANLIDEETTNIPSENTTDTNFKEIAKRARVVTDYAGGPDKLNFTRYANAFAELINNPEMGTPITIGIYGKWGAGKSFLMNKIKDAIRQPNQRRNWEDKFSTLKSRAKKTAIDIHITEFNAWVYSGSDHLWASLVTHLYKDIEKYFGIKAYLMRLTKAFRKSFPQALGAFAFYSLLALLLSFLVDYNRIQETWNATQIAINALAGSIIGGSALASLPILWSAMREFFDNLFLSRANKLQKLAMQPDFHAQIGIMADIKEEIKFIRELLKNGKGGRPTRLVLFIDDLDRCEHRKAIEVLQAIMLLLADEDGSPFVIFLGIDARVVVKAIEEHYGEMLVKAGINGYEYLDKIIQIPFVIPTVSKNDIGGYVDSLIWSSDEEKKKITELWEPQLANRDQLLPNAEQAIPKQQRLKNEPQLPTTAAMLEVENTNDFLPKSSIEEIPVTFTKPEREALKTSIADLTENPRKIKRIINIYRLARLLIPPSFREQQKIIRWILITEQWPLHMSWIIEHIENDIRTDGKLRNKSVLDVYIEIKDSIYTEDIETMASIDADPNLFEQTLRNDPVLTVKDVLDIMPITFNLNPAIRSDVSRKMIQMMKGSSLVNQETNKNTKK